MSNIRSIDFRGYVGNDSGVLTLGDGDGHAWPVHELIAEEWPASPIEGATVIWAYAPPATPPVEWMNAEGATTASGDLAFDSATLAVEGESAADLRADWLDHLGEYVHLRINAE